MPVPSMSLAPGSRVGPYEVTALIGRGGMGEVYRARDVRLHRDVALKALPDSLAGDAARFARFRREAQLLATLNHPHIATIHGLEEPPAGQGAPVLVMELVDGPTLDELLHGSGPRAPDHGPPAATLPEARSPKPAARTRTSRGLPIAEALAIARQIAEALEAAHEQGVIHRDLKPSNIKVRPDGTVKVLDFGLAKAIEPAVTSPDFAEGSTVTSPAMTQAGMLLGTAVYMAPEQAMGKPADRRADIWAFGAVLYEMLTGRRAFEGTEVTEVLAGIIKSDPDWSALPADLPPGVRTCLRRCLQKPPRQRLQAIGDARLALEGAFDELPVGPVAAPPRPRERTTWLAAVLVGTALVAALGTRWFYVHQFQQQPTPITFSIPSPEDSSFNTLAGHAVSPDGRYVAFVASGQLWVHSFGSAASRQLAGTQGAASPFWSPDGRWIGFFGGGSLKKIQVAGGTPLDLCDVGFQRGGTWNSDDVIVFGSSVGPLQQITAGGGTPTPVSAMAENETGHWWPWFLPDGEHFLYLAATGDRRDLRVGSLTSADSAPLGNFESHVAYGAGHLFFLQGRNLMAQPFDTDRLQTTAEPLLVADGRVAMNVWQQGGFSASAAGVLSYLKGGNARYQLMWVDRSGKLLERVGEPRVMATLSLSPDKQRVAVSSPTAGTYDIWVLDLARGGAGTPVTFGPNHEFDPAWSSDGLRLLFNSNRTGLFSLYRRASDGTGDEELLKGSQTDLTLPDWSADGRSIVYTERGLATTGLDLWTLPLSSDGPPGRPTIFLQTPFNEGAGVFSPNGDWIAYESDESGRYEVHMRRFPSAEDRKPISREGGRSPQWRRDGRELYYLAPDQTLMAVAVDEATGDVGVPQPLPVKAVGASSSYAASGDGRRFLVKTVDAPASWEFTVVVNWPATADH